MRLTDERPLADAGLDAEVDAEPLALSVCTSLVVVASSAVSSWTSELDGGARFTATW
jgi:hypothetical protein